MTTFADTRAYVIALPAKRAQSRQWQQAADLLPHNAGGGSKALATAASGAARATAGSSLCPPAASFP